MLVGIGLAIGIYSLYTYFATRERMYGWFAGFALFGIAFQLHHEGFAFLVLWRQHQWVGNFAATTCGMLQAVFTIGFMRTLIETERILPRADRWLYKPMSIPLLPAFALLATHWWLANQITALVVAVSTLSLTAAALIGALRGQLEVKSILVASLLLGVTGTLFMLKQIGVIPDLPVFSWMFPFALGLAMMTFALAMAERVRRLAQAHRLAEERNAERLEQMVLARTAELEVAKTKAETALANLQTAQTELVAAGKMASLGQLVAGVAHEINTPIGVAITAASFLVSRSGEVKHQLATGGLPSSDLLAYVSDADRSASMVGLNLDRAAQLIRTFKQVSVDRSSDDRRRFNLAQTIGDLNQSLALTWKRRPVTLHIDCPSDIELDSYPGALGQIITNLIQNALLHAFEGERTGNMRLTAGRTGKDAIELVFEDDGQGITAEALTRIFEPFYTTKRGKGGTGLGLHIVFNLVTAKLGGRIEVSSEPGVGLRLRMRIPCSAPL